MPRENIGLAVAWGSSMDLSEYSLEMLREDSGFVLYRAHPPTGSNTLLLLATRSIQDSTVNLTRLKHEYALSSKLDPSWAAQPLELGEYNGRNVLFLADPGGRPLSGALGRPFELKSALSIAVKIGSALSNVHARGIIHKDFNPANVILDAEGNIHLTGFGSAMLLLRERQPPIEPEVISGSLAYIAPEQTGRTGRWIDARSDLYSFGATLYQMITGELPFATSDPVELIHCHVARKPLAPSARIRHLPKSVDAIILKLLEKTPEDRYQTAAGVTHDLQRCLSQWESVGQIADYRLGELDRSDRLRLPEVVYGRDEEITTLLNAFDRVATHGLTQFIVLSGPSGVGKSSLIGEVSKKFGPPRGLFASGKFDQQKQDVPYATLTQALRQLVHQLLSRSDVELSAWQHALTEALVPNGRLVTDLIPELTLIVGQLPLVPDVPPQDRQNRFQVTFCRFMAVFACTGHPLVLFLDDLQWVDKATLDLLEHLRNDPSFLNLLLIGAYRQAEPSSDDRIARTINKLRGTGILEEVRLSALTVPNLRLLIADALQTDVASIDSLVALVSEKTEGNPFFVIQFLLTLEDKGLLFFDIRSRTWQWSIDRIRDEAITDQVAELMVAKLGRYSDAALAIMSHLACLGSFGKTTTLALALEVSEETIDLTLENVVRTGLLRKLDGGYAFSHDRVQEAAYGLIPIAKRSSLHLSLGKVLYAQCHAHELEENVFEIVNQFNRGPRLASSCEREQLAQFNFLAGTRAKSSSAYESALRYFLSGQELLASTDQGTSQLTFELALNRAECELWTGDLISAETSLTLLSSMAATASDLARVVWVAVAVYFKLDRNTEAVGMCLEYLRRLGINWSLNPTADEVDQEYRELLARLGIEPIEMLVKLPTMTDEHYLTTMEVLAALQTSAFYTSRNLWLLLLGRMTNISLKHGNCELSALSYSLVALILGPRFGDYRRGLSFGKLAYNLAETGTVERFKSRVYANFSGGIMPWTTHIRKCVAPHRRAIEAALDAGDRIYATWSRSQLIASLFACGFPLDQVQDEVEETLRYAENASFGYFAAIIKIPLQLILSLRGLTPIFGSFDEADFNERAVEKGLKNEPPGSVRAFRYWVRKLQAGYFSNDLPSALNAADKARACLATTPLYFETAEYHLYAALTLSAELKVSSSIAETEEFLIIKAHHEQLVLWAKDCPETFDSRAAMIAGELARLEGKELDAELNYEKAIRSAREQGFTQNEAMAHELAAKFHYARGLLTMGDDSARNARSCFARWGAVGKVRQLEGLHPHLRSETALSRPNLSVVLPVANLELATVLRVSQAISGEIDLKHLVSVLLEIALEYSGADKGVLLLANTGEMQVEAEAVAVRDSVEVRLVGSTATAKQLPLSIVRYVVRTRQNVVISGDDSERPYAMDEYIIYNRPKAILCLPLVKRGSDLVGVLYLESGTSPGVFNASRLAVLEFLASQAAISIENARLYLDIDRANQIVLRTQDEHRQSFDMIPALAWSASPNGNVEFANKQWHDYTGIRPEELSGTTWIQAFHPDDFDKISDKWRELIETGTAGEVEARMLSIDGLSRRFLIRATPLRDANGTIVRWYGTNIDIDDLKKAEQLILAEKTLLQMMADGYGLDDILNRLCKSVQELTEGGPATLTLLNQGSGNTLHCVAPNLSPSFKAAIESGHIIPTNAEPFHRETLFASDLDADPLWFKHRDLALAHGLRACWSSPVLSFEGGVLGTLALYSREARRFTSEERSICVQFTHLASVVVGRKRNEERLKGSLLEKDVLLKEVHHRVKNNLQLISSLLNLQSSKVDDLTVREMLSETRNRVHSMALVHENLYRAGDFGRISIDEHIQHLCAHLTRAYGVQARNIQLTSDVDELILDLDSAVSVGLILNELVSNSLKHAFPNNRRGVIRIALKTFDDGRYSLSVDDDGIGLPAALDILHSETMGLQLVQDLASQLRGEMIVTRSSGTSFVINFALDSHMGSFNEIS
jgi:PAS domain S-box-containing protein